MNPLIKRTDHMIQTLQLIHNAGHDSAIIAGGAIRDAYHGVIESDIDIFIMHPSVFPQGSAKPDCMPAQQFSHNDWKDYWSRVLRLRTTQFGPSDSASAAFSVYAADTDLEHMPSQEILAVWNVFRGLNMYQIIFLNMDPVAYVNDKFDFGLCKAYCDGHKVHFTRDFMHDSHNRKISMVGKDLTTAQVKYALDHHWPRIQEKYPGYSLHVPEHYIQPIV